MSSNDASAAETAQSDQNIGNETPQSCHHQCKPQQQQQQQQQQLYINQSSNILHHHPYNNNTSINNRTITDTATIPVWLPQQQQYSHSHCHLHLQDARNNSMTNDVSPFYCKSTTSSAIDCFSGGGGGGSVHVIAKQSLVNIIDRIDSQTIEECPIKAIGVATGVASQQQQISSYQQPLQNRYADYTTDIVGGNANVNVGDDGRTYITPIDIPTPPPPLPPNCNHTKRLAIRCQCDHPIETVPMSMSTSTSKQKHQQLYIHHNPGHYQQQEDGSNNLKSLTQYQQKQLLQGLSNNNNNNFLTRDCSSMSNHQQQHQNRKNPRQHNQSHLYQLHHRNPEQLLPVDSTIIHHGYGIGDRINRLKNLVQSQRKIRRICIILSIVFGLVVIGLLVTALVVVLLRGSDKDDQPTATDNAIDLEDVLSGQLSAKRFNGTWYGSSFIYKENNDIVEFDTKTKQKTVLYTDFNQHYVLYEKSADGRYLLLAKNYIKNYRHSFLAHYDVYDFSTKDLHPLTVQGEQRAISMIQWSPVGNGMILNYARNLYYKKNPLEEEVVLTTDTHELIFNGIPDWVYEEEVFSSNSAAWFNPNGTQIAFIKFDDSSTRIIDFPIYGEAGDLTFQYPFHRVVSYPKAGSSNPHITLHTSNLERATQGLQHLTKIPVPSSLNVEADNIITAVDWLDDTNVLSVWMNRIQNEAYMQVFDGVHRHEIYGITSRTGWVDLFSAPFKNRDGSRIALILPQLQSTEAGYYRHICTLSTAAGVKATPDALTRGLFVVQSILHWDASSNIIFYTANTELHSEILHVYAIRSSTGQTPQCLTCGLHTSDGIEQNYYSADFNTDRQVVISSLGPGVPQHAVYEWTYTNNQVVLSKIMDWETNTALITKLKGIAMPTLQIDTIDMENGFTAKVLMQLPPNLDTSGNTKYPMLVDVYGGPDSYSVVNKWMLDWGTYLSSNQSVIYVKIDGRGSGLRGDSLLHSIYLKLGTLEISDQIAVAQKLQKKFDFIDPNHMGIWGWSYGGYAAAMALANDDQSVFKCAASIAPVTDWAYYDSIYTERYMGLPTVNEEGYNNSRLSTRAEKLRGKKFLLVHGTLDDNVHFQQAMILSKSLEHLDILFKQISYPDEDHGLAGVRPHLYHSLDRFFGDCFESKRLMNSQ